MSEEQVKSDSVKPSSTSTDQLDDPPLSTEDKRIDQIVKHFHPLTTKFRDHLHVFKKEPQWLVWLRHPYFIYSLLFVVLLLQGLWTVHQTFVYRQEYQKLNLLHQEQKRLNIEWGKMLIEKQTFGSSGQIATRATELGMFSPHYQQRIIITLPKDKTTP